MNRFNAVLCFLTLLKIPAVFLKSFLLSSSECVGLKTISDLTNDLADRVAAGGGGGVVEPPPPMKCQEIKHCDLFLNMCLMFNGLASFIAFRLERWTKD